jgi:predicted adenylyl cyclase CyaB
VVRKQRTLFLKDNIRFHLDRVEGLGDFMEIEYIVSQAQNKEAVKKEVDLLLNALRIQKESLIGCSYIDLLAEPAKQMNRNQAR